MSRLIDGDLLKTRINIADVSPAFDAMLKALIDHQPTVDAVPIVNATPCDFCAYNPPSSTDGKPCTMCPACKRIKEA